MVRRREALSRGRIIFSEAPTFIRNSGPPNTILCEKIKAAAPARYPAKISPIQVKLQDGQLTNRQ